MKASAKVPRSCDACPKGLECSVYEGLCALAFRGGYVRVEDAVRLGVPREAIEGLPAGEGYVHVEDLWHRLPRLCARWRR